MDLVYSSSGLIGEDDGSAAGSSNGKQAGSAQLFGGNANDNDDDDDDDSDDELFKVVADAGAETAPQLKNTSVVRHHHSNAQLEADSPFCVPNPTHAGGEA